MNKTIVILLISSLILTLLGCGNQQDFTKASETMDANLYSEMETEEKKQQNEVEAETKMKVQIGNSSFTAILEDNAAVKALVEMMEKEPVVIRMRDYSGFEKVGALGTTLPTSNRQVTTQSGDIVLYQGNQIVIFYGSNSWSYTRLGRIEDLTGWREALGSGDITVTFSLEES